MRRNRILTLFFYFAIISEVTHASLWASRKLLDVAPKGNAIGTSPVSPLISPVSSDSQPVNGKKKQSEPPAPNNSSTSVDPKPLNTLSSGTSPAASESAKDKPVEPKKGETEAGPQSSKKNCDGVPDNKKCKDMKKLVACIQSNLDSRDFAVLVQNEGEDTLKVNVTGGKIFKELTLLKHHTEKIPIPQNEEKILKIVVNAGNGECVLHTSPLVYGENFFLRLPSYEQLATPVNGAYLLIFTVVILGGSWAWCCKFRRRQRGGGVPYHELEMAQPESCSAINVESAQGWDDGWDDDWDEENSVKSPGGSHLGGISANGLSARPNKEGWENDWDV